MQKLKLFIDTQMSQTQLAEKLGVSQPTVSDWVNGNTRPSFERLADLSRITGISIEDLVKEAIA